MPHLQSPFGGGNLWKFSLQLNYGFVSNVSSDKGCDKATWNIFGSTCVPGANTYTALSITKIYEWSSSFLVEKRLGEKSSLVVAPSVYNTLYKSTNTLTGNSANVLSFDQKAWNYSMLLAYNYRTDSNLLWSFGAGASSTKTFGNLLSKRVIAPIVDLKLQL